ncbi:unnamed protein product [Dovyalis caffra]|uniref:Uncharacterized protein n=1 Tax=Dovyalis caffra TaxID=77055 RepID=A0AAV1RKI9_9ROSI|nr:unnamed protein product [Dovyalis caffra]
MLSSLEPQNSYEARDKNISFTVVIILGKGELLIVRTKNRSIFWDGVQHKWMTLIGGTTRTAFFFFFSVFLMGKRGLLLGIACELESAALILHRHPTWTPTTKATDVKTDRYEHSLLHKSRMERGGRTFFQPNSVKGKLQGNVNINHQWTCLHIFLAGHEKHRYGMFNYPSEAATALSRSNLWHLFSKKLPGEPDADRIKRVVGSHKSKSIDSKYPLKFVPFLVLFRESEDHKLKSVLTPPFSSTTTANG